MERYRTLGKANVQATSEALEASGATILERPSPYSAPYEYRVRTPDGETVDLVCYAFTANEYGQEGRPEDEHRFQVKYGSDFKRYHTLYVDPSRTRITLMYGVHHERGLFVAVDPSMHTPTWFSMSVEFKEAQLELAKRSGWQGWERERSSARRKRPMPNETLLTESVIAFKPEHFLRYAFFERIATGMDTGERLLLSDRISRNLSAPTAALVAQERHPLERQLGLSANEILDVLGGSFRLLVAVRGSVAEHHLGAALRKIPGLSRIQSIDADGQPDFEVEYKRRTYRIECKNVLRRVTAAGPRVDFQKTRAAKGNPCSRYYSGDQFEILAACLHPVTEKWEFKFAATASLPAHRSCPGRIHERIDVTGTSWSDSLVSTLEALR